jgi:nucleoside-diphosphate kinase
VAAVERTLVVLKPDAVARGLVGRLLQRFEDAGLKIVAITMRMMDAEFTRRHYFDLEERFGSGVYEVTAAYMRSGPVVGMVLEGVEAVANVRRLVGPTFPNQAAPGTIRGDFAHVSKAYADATHRAIANLVHASGNADEAKYEIGVWFRPDDQVDHETALERYVR